MNKDTLIGDNIRKYRKMNGMLLKYLAEEIGLSVQGLHKIEKSHTSPRSETLMKIMEVLCITPNQLFGVEEMPDKNYLILKRIKQEE